MTVVWSRSAEITFNEEVDFIFNKWGLIEVEKFIDLVEDFLEILKTGILTGRFSKLTNAHFFVLSKQTTLVYRINKNKGQIDLLLFWNNKRNPSDFEKYLKN